MKGGKRKMDNEAELQTSVEFYKTRATRMSTMLRQKSEENKLMAAQIAKLDQDKARLAAENAAHAGRELLREDERKEQNATIARLRIQVRGHHEIDPGFDPTPPQCSDSGGVPSDANGEKQMKTWLRTARFALRKCFPDPVKLHIVLRKLAASDLTASDVCELLKLRKQGLRDCIPEDFLATIIRVGQQEYRDFLQANITPELAENLCKTLLLSRAKYERLNAKLFQTMSRKDDGELGYVSLKFNGVSAPSLPSRYARDKYKEEIAEAFEHESQDDGLSTSLNLRKVIKAAVLVSMDQGYLAIVDGHVKQLDGRDVQVMKYTDTANQFKGMKVTASAVQLPDGSSTPNSPFHTSEYALYEGGDGYEDIILLGRHEVEQANELLGNLNLDLGPLMLPVHGPLRDGEAREVVPTDVTCLMEFSLGGDQSHANAMNGLAGCNCSHPCIYCECSKHDMCDLNFGESSCVTRTRERIMLLAHTALGTCPGCEKQIVQKGDVVDPNQQCELAIEGDAQPDVPAKFKVLARPRFPVTWTSLHKGVVYGRTPPYNTDPDNWITCILHLNLCIVRGLFTKTIVAELGKVPQAEGKEKVAFTKQVDAMAELLCAAGLRMKKSKLTKTKGMEVGKYDERLKNSGLGGRDAEYVMNAYDSILMMMYPEKICGPWVPDDILFEDDDSFDAFYQHAERDTEFSSPAVKNALLVRRAWFMWDRTWKLLNSPMDFPKQQSYTLEEVKKVWAQRASAVETYAIAFINSWVAAVGSTQGLYLHVLARHIPEQIRKYGDLRTRQTQGLEHCHHCRKEVGTHATNRKQGERLAQMLAHSSMKRAVMQQDEVTRCVIRGERLAKSKGRFAKRHLAKHLRLQEIKQTLFAKSELCIDVVV
jgi:hypothetical protein